MTCSCMDLKGGYALHIPARYATGSEGRDPLHSGDILRTSKCWMMLMARARRQGPLLGALPGLKNSIPHGVILPLSPALFRSRFSGGVPSVTRP